MTYFEGLSKANFSLFDNKARMVVQGAYDLAKQQYHNPADVPHLLSSLLEQGDTTIFSALEKMGKKVEDIKKTAKKDLFNLMFRQLEEFSMSEDLDSVLVNAEHEMKSLNDAQIRTEHLLLSVLHTDNKSKYLLEGHGITYKDMEKILKTDKLHKESHEKKNIGTGSEGMSSNILNIYGEELTQLARDGKLHEVIGRNDEVNLMMEILCRKNKNNPIIIGEPGVGKTSVAELLIQRIAKGDVPDTLKNKKVFGIDIGLLNAGVKYKGEFEERLKAIFKEIESSNGEILLFVDGIHNIVGKTDGSTNMSDTLKSALSKGKIRIFGVTTTEDYKKAIEKDRALSRIFQSVMVEEPSRNDSIAILRGIKHTYEAFHGVKIADVAVVAAVDLSMRYLSDHKLPDNAIDVMDQAAAKARITISALPEKLVEIEKKISELEKEKSAIAVDIQSFAGDKAQASFGARSLDIEKEIEELNISYKTQKSLWEENKKYLLEIKTYSQQIQEFTRQLGIAKQENNTEIVEKITHEAIPELRKKINVLDELLKTSATQGNVVVNDIIDYNDIASVVSKLTGIPLTKLAQAEADKLEQLEKLLGAKVIGQDKAITAVSNAIRRARSGLKNPNKPVGSFLFLGPTGVGKTELCKALSSILFDDEKSMIRFDMSEYMEKHSAAKFIGPPPGYVGYEEGGQLTQAVKNRPYSVLLLDEVEKAHPDIFNLLLQVLDDGRLTDNKGCTVDFKNLIIIMTSNIGADIIIDKLQESEDSSKDSIPPLVEKEPLSLEKDILPLLQNFFRPEFINRLDDTVLFNSLNRASIRKIVDIQLRSFSKLAKKEKMIDLEFSNDSKEFLARKGWNPAFGARPLNRAIQDHLTNVLALNIIQGKFVEGDKISVSCQNDGLIFTKIEDDKVK